MNQKKEGTDMGPKAQEVDKKNSSQPTTGGENDVPQEPLILKSADKLLLGGSLGLGILFMWFFFEKYPGISVPVFVTAFYALLLVYTRPVWKKDALFGWFLCIPVLMLSLTFFLFDNEALMVMNLLLLPWLIMLQTLLITGANSFKWFSPGILVDLLFGLFFRCIVHIAKPFRFTAALFHSGKSKREKKSVGVRVLAGLLLSVPILLILLVLLSSADMVFGKLVEQIPDFFTDIRLDQFIGRTFVTLVIFFITFSYLWSIRSGEKPAEYSLSGNSGKAPEQKYRFDFVIITTVTAAIDVLYVIFVIIQFAYLFGGSGLPEGFTYAEYARSGFFELILVSLLNIGYLSFSLNYTKKGGPAANTVFQILNTIMIGCTFVMLISAHYRMSLYEDAYGFTFLRIMTHAFMVFLLVLFVITLVRVWKEGMSLLKPYIAVAIVAYVVINYMNVDVMISKNNIERFRQNKIIDMGYFRSLSNDVVPDLILLSRDSNSDISAAARELLDQRKKELSKEQPWQSYNISDAKAKNLLGIR